MLSLAYRIAAMKSVSFSVAREESRLYSRQKIPLVTKVELTNVHEFVSSKIDANNRIDIAKEVPNWSPPFKQCFFEFNAKEISAQFGAMVSVVRGVDVESDKFEWMLIGYVWAAMMGESRINKGMPDYVKNGRPLYLGECGVTVSKKGEFLGLRCDHLEDQPELGEGFAIVSTMTTIGMGISFMHCKNVKQVEAKEDPGERFLRQYKVPKFTYRTLCIDPMKEVLRREGQSEAAGLKRALHICRGHFSTYSDEKPLFGKYAGTFWVPDHVRGKKEHGEVVKDYEVKSG